MEDVYLRAKSGGLVLCFSHKWTLVKFLNGQDIIDAGYDGDYVVLKKIKSTLAYLLNEKPLERLWMIALSETFNSIYVEHIGNNKFELSLFETKLDGKMTVIPFTLDELKNWNTLLAQIVLPTERDSDV